jgi:hypothetical protein
LRNVLKPAGSGKKPRSQFGRMQLRNDQMVLIGSLILFQAVQVNGAVKEPGQVCGQQEGGYCQG